MTYNEIDLVDGSLEQLKYLVAKLKNVDARDVNCEFKESFFGFNMCKLIITYYKDNYKYSIEGRSYVTNEECQMAGITEYELKINMINSFVKKCNKEVEYVI